MSKASLSKYFIFVILFTIVLLYKIFTIELISDNLNYYNVYNNIQNDTMPFQYEFILSLLMYISSLLGMDYYQFTFFKVLTFLPIIIFIDKNISNRNNIFSYLFLFSFISPPMIGTLIFLARQSLSLEFFLLLSLIHGFRKKIPMLIIMFFTHMGSIIWVPIFLWHKKIIAILNSKLFWLMSLFILLISIFTGMDLTKTLIQYLSTLNNLPSFLMANLARKRDFYVIHEETDFDTLSMLNTFFAILPVLIYITMVKIKEIEHYTIECLCALYGLSFFLFALFYNNQIFATRVGFVAYFFGVQYLFLFLLLAYLNKRNLLHGK
ncbi:TPA: EpsG family protein [Klebsiella michiganensis]|uniref:EpsG family protein n=1 Tax=Klebsiella michiganensis TaxID=1134687 RepID=UPI001AE9DFD8|nr:EpsG family protein [Klebsiella michiganensis]